MEPSWFEKLLDLISETVKPFGHDITDSRAEIERIYLVHILDDGKLADLSLTIEFDKTYDENAIHDVPLPVWEGYKMKLNEIVTGLTVTTEQHVTKSFGEVIDELAGKYPDYHIDASDFSYEESVISWSPSDHSGEFFEFVVMR